jgi:ribosome-associated toxin RatA of RatAB toxin-antitoxin module
LELKRSVLVPYSVESMFDLIEQAEWYPQFLPWCVGANILERSDDWVAARLEFCYLRFHFGFETRNAKRRPDWLKVRLVEGPFRRLEADWSLIALGDLGCKINFDLSYEISDGLLDQIARPAVDFVSRSMVDAFVKRAERTLTASAPSPSSVAATEARPASESPITVTASEPP